MEKDDRIEALADDLFRAYSNNEPIGPLTDRADLTTDEAYRIQQALINQRKESENAQVVGHKVGLTSDAMQEQLGVDTPDFGHILDSMIVTDDSISRDDLIAPRIEPELGYLLDEPLEPPISEFDVISATDAVLPVLEVIDSRIANWDVQLEDTIADNASSAFVVPGATALDPRDFNPALEGVILRKNGETVETGIGANVLGHPARGVVWLTQQLNDLGESLASGQLVLCGSFTSSVELEADDVFTAEFTTAGTVSVAID